MELPGWNILLFAGKWVFIGLVYFILAIVVYQVRREMSTRAGTSRPVMSYVPGRLRVISPGSDSRAHQGLVLPLQAQNRLGSDPDNDIILSDGFISRQHAWLKWDGVAWWVEDQGSRNGTFVNNHPCAPQTPQRVPFGAVIRLGDMSFELQE